MVFNGQVDTVESGAARSGGGGRRLWIEAKGADMKGDAKSPYTNSAGTGDQKQSWGGSQFSSPDLRAGSTSNPSTGGSSGGSSNASTSMISFLQKILPPGFSLQPDAITSSIMRDFWFQGNESFYSILQRLANDVGFNFKVDGDNVVKLFGETTSGTNIDAVWGVNLLAWRIKPFIGRPQFQAGRMTWFDAVNGRFWDVFQSIGGSLPFGRAGGIASLPAMAPNRQMGSQSANALGQDSRFERGQGWALINGEPLALADRYLNIIGARQGVDAQYWITEAQHSYLRSGGYTTRCELKQPEMSIPLPSWPTTQVTPQPLPDIPPIDQQGTQQPNAPP
jgi:hypothetical protein